MVPNYQAKHARQAIGLEGPDLIDQWCWKILASAKAISCNLI